MTSAPVPRAATLMDVSNVHQMQPNGPAQKMPDPKERADIEAKLETMFRKEGGYECKWMGCRRSFACWDVLKKHLHKIHCSPMALSKNAKRLGRPGTSSRPPKIHACQWEPCHAGTKFSNVKELMDHVLAIHLEGERNCCPVCGHRSHTLWLAVNHLYRSHPEAFPLDTRLLLPRPFHYPPAPPLPAGPIWCHNVSVPSMQPSTSGGRIWTVPPPSNALVIPEKLGKRIPLAMDGIVRGERDMTPRDPRAVESLNCDIDWDEPRIGWEVMLAKLS